MLKLLRTVHDVLGVSLPVSGPRARLGAGPPAGRAAAAAAPPGARVRLEVLYNGSKLELSDVKLKRPQRGAAAPGGGR